MGPEYSYGGAYGVASRRNSAQRRLDAPSLQAEPHTNSATSSIGRVILGFCLVLLVLGVLPASFVFWACIIVLLFTCLRLRLQAQNLQRALEQGQAPLADGARLHPGLVYGGSGGGGGGGGGPVIRVIPGGGLLLLHAEPRVALEHLNMQLRQLDEEMGLPADEDVFLMRHGFHGARGAAASAGFAPGLGPSPGARPPPVSDADIAALPCYPYKPPRGGSRPAAAATQAPAALPQAEDPAAAAALGGAGGLQAPFVPSFAAAAHTPEAARLGASAGSSGVCGGSSLSRGAPLPSSAFLPAAGLSLGGSAAGAGMAAQTGMAAHSSLAPAPRGSPCASSGGEPGGPPGEPGTPPSHPATSAASTAATASAAAAAESPADGGLKGHGGSGGGGLGFVGGTGDAVSGESSQHHGLTCPVCLDPVAEGAIVMTLPCLHQFHAACVTPWLRQQGLNASCPMCKTPVFR